MALPSSALLHCEWESTGAGSVAPTSPPSSALLARECDLEDGEEDGSASPAHRRPNRERGYIGMAAGLSVALCLGFALCWREARHDSSPLSALAGNIEETVLAAAPLCTAEQGSNAPGSGCTEAGQIDDDCCAMSGHGGCAGPGFDFTEGGACYDNGALASCCKPKEIPEEDQWECHSYSNEGENDDWCATVGVVSGMRFKWVGEGAWLCQEGGKDCWCCKQPETFAPSPPPPPPPSAAPGGDWGCHEYHSDQDNDWCLRVGIEDGVEYSWTAEGGVCGDCWCCSRQARDSGLTPYPDFGGTMDTVGIFCWLVSQSSGPEAALTRDHFAKKHNVFACNEWSVFSDGHGVAPVPATDIGVLNSKWATWGSWRNTGVFLRAWSTVLSQGKYSRHAWTAKADTDAVWFPDRLRMHLDGIGGEAPLYLHNNGTYLGPLEVFSNGAVKLFGEQWRTKCMLKIDVSGEDGYIEDCMERMNVPVLNDVDLLFSTHETEACDNDTKVAFHPFKDVDGYNDCFTTAMR